MAEPQKQSFTSVTPIAQQQTFSNVTPIDSGDQPGMLDREIPLSGPWYNPTLSGLQSVGRGVRGAISGALQTLDPRAKEGTWEEKAQYMPGAVPAGRLAGSLLDLGRQATEVPAAIRDINASPDPLGSYAKGAQDAAGDAAGQALTAAATEGLTRLPAGKIARTMGEVGKPVAEGAAKLPVVKDVVTAGKTLGKYKGMQGRIADIWKEPFKDPGGALPDAPPPDVLKARGLFEGTGSADVPADPAAGLGTIKTPKPGQAGQLAASMQEAPAAAPPSAEVAPGFSRGNLQNLLDRSVGARKLEPNVPLRKQMGATSARPAAADAGIPEGHSAVDSSALRSYRYDPDAHEFHVRYKSGDKTYIFGDVSPEEAQAFEAAKSKGSAFQSIKGSHVEVARIINGKRVLVKGSQ